MGGGLLRRLLAAALLSLPLSAVAAAIARRNLAAMAANPTQYLAHKQALQQPSLAANFLVSLFLLVTTVLLVELVAFLLARVRLPARPAA